MLNDKMLKTVIDRANEMLKNDKIKAIYNAHKSKDEAQTWLTKVALASLIVPLEKRNQILKARQTK